MREKLCSSNAAERSQQEHQGMGKNIHTYRTPVSNLPVGLCAPTILTITGSQASVSLLLQVTEVTFYSTWKQNFVAGLRDKPCSKIA